MNPSYRPKRLASLFYVFISGLVAALVSSCSINPPPAPPCTSDTFSTPGIHQCGLWQDDEINIAAEIWGFFSRYSLRKQ